MPPAQPVSPAPPGHSELAPTVFHVGPPSEMQLWGQPSGVTKSVGRSFRTTSRALLRQHCHARAIGARRAGEVLPAWGQPSRDRRLSRTPRAVGAQRQALGGGAAGSAWPQRRQDMQVADLRRLPGKASRVAGGGVLSGEGEHDIDQRSPPHLKARAGAQQAAVLLDPRDRHAALSRGTLRSRATRAPAEEHQRQAQRASAGNCRLQDRNRFTPHYTTPSVGPSCSI